MGYSRYIGRVGALAVALGIGAALGATPWLASAEPSTSGSSAHSASTAPSSDSSSTGAATDSSSKGTATSRTGAVSGESDSSPSTASGSTRKSTKSPIGQVTSKSASPTPSGSSQPATRSADPGAVVSTGGADTDSPTGSSRSAGTAATTAAGGSEPDSTDATAPAQPTTAPATSGTTAAKTTRSAAAANTHASRTKAPASSVDATRVVADAVQPPTPPVVSAAATTPVRSAATMDITPGIGDSPRPSAATATAAAVTTPVNTVAEIVSSVVDAVLSPTASGTAPGEPAQTPALWTLAAFARREFERAFVNPSPLVDSVATSLTTGRVTSDTTLNDQSTDPVRAGTIGAPTPDLSDLTSTGQLSATAAEDPWAGEPSFVHQLFVGAFRAIGAVGKLFGAQSAVSLAAPLLESDSPPWFTTLGLNVQRSEFEGMPVWTLQSPTSSSGEYVVGLHGGGYVLKPSLLHWLDYADMARDTGATVVVPIYPLAPQGAAVTVVPQIADLIAARIDQHGAEDVSVYGDSAGGGLALAAVQELVRRGDPVPSHMVLISPELDVTLSDPASHTIDDPYLNASEVQSWGRLWAGDLDPADPRVSPLFGSLAGLPPIVVYSGSLDLLSPQVLRLRERALAEGADFTFVLRKGLIHDWAAAPLLLPEAAAVRPDIYQQLGIGPDASSSPTVDPLARQITNGLITDTPTLDDQSIDPAVTGETGAPPAGVSALTASPQLTATAEPATFTGEPSFVSRVFTAVFRVVNAVGNLLGVDLTIPLAQALSSESPPRFTTLGLNVQRSEFEGMPVWTLQSPGSASGKDVVAVHGGAFVAHPNIFNWLDYAAMARDTGATVIVPIYPLVPQGTAGTVVPAMADLVSSQIDQHGAENVSVYGDSAGGYIALAAVQELVRRGDPVPSHMVLISPPLDATLSNPAIPFVDDPLFSDILRLCTILSNFGPATWISPIRWSALCSGHCLGFRRPRSTTETWRSSLPMGLSSKTRPWRRRAPTSPSSSAMVKYTTGRSSSCCPRHKPFAQTFINSWASVPMSPRR